MTPGEQREGLWFPFRVSRIAHDIVPSGVLVRVAVRRGWNCVRQCEHVPPRPNEGGQNHGTHCDEYRFVCRIDDVAMSLLCFTWVLNGIVNDAAMARLNRLGRHVVYGAYANRHQSFAAGENCDIFGQCRAEDLGAIFADEFFESQFSALLRPLIVRPVDEVDLTAVTEAMEPLWHKMVRQVLEMSG